MSELPPSTDVDSTIQPADLAELVQTQTSGCGPCIVGITHGDGTAEIVVSSVPERFDHPGDALVGFRAPAEWSAMGLTLPIRARLLDEEGREDLEDDPLEGVASDLGLDHRSERHAMAKATLLTAILCRDGRIACLFDGPETTPTLVGEPPEGWMPDLLRRCLGLATPPPEESLGRFVETVWLDAAAAAVIGSIGARSNWPGLAQLHPLHPDETTPSGAVLAAETQDLERQSSWSRMRQLWCSSPSADSRPIHVPGTGEAPATVAGAELDRWFDDGSFSRWITRTLPPPEEMLEVILTLVDAEVGTEVAQALVTVAPPVQEEVEMVFGPGLAR